MYHRQPHPDLPAIPEESGPDQTPNSTSSTPIEEIDLNGDNDDLSSNAESYANSYAFTLDNVGFDEENSLVGSVVGSVIGMTTSNNNASSTTITNLVHITPPSSQYSPDRISRHERKLHRETCRTLGLPYSEDTLDSSPDSSKRDDSILGSISASSGSADELERKRSKKIEKLWPWPTKASKENVPFKSDIVERQSSSSGSSSNSTIAKISETTLTYTTRMKDAVASFNERIEEAYERSKHQQGSEAINSSTDLQGFTSKNFDRQVTEKTEKSESQSKRPKTVSDLLFRPNGWVDSYKQANSMTKLTVGTTILFFLLCIIVILATVNVTKSGETNDPNWNGDGTDVDLYHGGLDNDTHPNNISDAGGNSGNANGFSATEVVAAVSTASPSSQPTPLSSYTPTAIPSKALVSNNEHPCIDNEGKFQNVRGKRRECHWLSIHDPGALRTDRLDAECGAVDEFLKPPSELAMHCRYACRWYNGCPFTADTVVEQLQVDESAVAMQAAPEADAAFETFTADSAKTHAPTSYAPTPTKSTTANPVADVDSTTTSAAAAEEEGTIQMLPMFLDIRGGERQCWWLDIRNQNQRLIRRDANCVKVSVQLTCPDSCADYVTMDVLNSEQQEITGDSASQSASSQASGSGSDNGSGSGNGSVSGGQEASSQAANSQASGSGGQEVMSQASSFAGSVESFASMAGDNTKENEVTATPSVLLRTNNNGNGAPTTMERQNDNDPLLQQEMCFDKDGYYLNHHGKPSQCSWLINSQEPTDETRRIRNCGYAGSEYPEGTDLGRMCKDTCGTCGL